MSNLNTAAIGAPIARLGISFFPIYLPGNELPEIATGDGSGLLLDELETASVAALRAANPTDTPVLVVEGEHFLGGKQIGKLLGHSGNETSARYAHLAQDPIHETAERIADSIAADILWGTPHGLQPRTLSGSTVRNTQIPPNHPLATTGEFLAPEPFV